ncbi:hypothetical protein D3C87_1579360 [compost metagenome]
MAARRVDVRTQRRDAPALAPEGVDENGAVVLFGTLVDGGSGLFPGDNSGFRYLIPDDDAHRRYSATELFSRALKSAKAASSDMTAAKGANVGAKTVKSVAKETFEGGKNSRKGAVSNGRVKGGFWDSLENGKIELHLNRGSTNVPKLADVTGPKMIDGLGNPSTGYQQLMTNVKSPDSMFQSMVKGVGSQAAEAMESVRNS